MLHHFTSSLALAYVSCLVGMLVDSWLQKTSYYQKWSNLNFITSKSVNRYLGLSGFKWIVKNTFFKYLNQKIKIEGKLEPTTLQTLRKEMTFSEISHLIGFVFVSFFAVYQLAKGAFLFALIITLVNIFMNMYPSLLQQENKRRIDRLLKVAERSQLASAGLL